MAQVSMKDLPRSKKWSNKVYKDVAKLSLQNIPNHSSIVFLIVIDFEATCFKEQGTIPHEIIEFPAVLINLTSGRIVEEFHQYMKPIERPLLSCYCRNLTGITQRQVDEGIQLQEAIKLFDQWLHLASRKHGLVMAGLDKDGNCALATWSDWDLGKCLKFECNRKKIFRPSVFTQWIDLKYSYGKFYARRPRNLEGSLNDVGLQFMGRPHSGLEDARNTAKLAHRMFQDGIKFVITSAI